ncbi:MAG: hypothetical protein R6V83_04235 [Candidatus Thorarchaeota archaeon]
MKVVQMEVSPEEHALLVQRTKHADKSLQDLLRSIIRSYLLSENMNPDGSFFGLKFEGKEGKRSSAEDDATLYGTDEDSLSS